MSGVSGVQERRVPREPHLVAFDEAEFALAVQSQRSTVQKALARYGIWGSAVDDVFHLVSGELWASLGRWEIAPGSPTLGQWANGVARNTARGWLRKERPGLGPGGMSTVSIDSLVERPAKDEVEANLEAAAIIRTLQAEVVREPGGVARWERMVRDVTHASRGANARKELVARLQTMHSLVSVAAPD